MVIPKELEPTPRLPTYDGPLTMWMRDSISVTIPIQAWKQLWGSSVNIRTIERQDVLIVQVCPNWQFTFESLMTGEGSIRKQRGDGPRRSNLQRSLCCIVFSKCFQGQLQGAVSEG